MRHEKPIRARIGSPTPANALRTTRHETHDDAHARALREALRDALPTDGTMLRAETFPRVDVWTDERESAREIVRALRARLPETRDPVEVETIRAEIIRLQRIARD